MGGFLGPSARQRPLRMALAPNQGVPAFALACGFWASRPSQPGLPVALCPAQRLARSGPGQGILRYGCQVVRAEGFRQWA